MSGDFSYKIQIPFILEVVYLRVSTSSCLMTRLKPPVPSNPNLYSNCNEIMTIELGFG
ncbi:hypothetical protein C1752_07261 [Acaryochloris thomasi RCC1774]|uniref:Uncharacterized protein n=1 Tax=Acaryochloris thomasi RCC1774 TaxID=1764569 RepID=A0A2W1JB30_9CYAN|nr:hypothetical protein C1752_07261 [Acaryochloris thomasi RCC1774]